METRVAEEWREIEGFNGRYAVSNYGRVRQCAAPGGSKWGNRKAIQEKIISYRISLWGYHRVSLQNPDGKYQSYSVHRLVALTFIPNPDNLPQVNHLNEDKSDNYVGNLEWSTASHNTNWGTRNDRVSQKLKVPIVRVDIYTGEKLYFESTRDARRKGYKVMYKRNRPFVRVGGRCSRYLWFRTDEEIIIPEIKDIRKRVIGSSVYNDSVIEFESLSAAQRNGYSSKSITDSFTSGKSYKNYYWKIAK